MTNSLTLAAQLARKVGMVPTWPNVQTIRLAIESEAEFSGVTIEETAAMIAKAARERTQAPAFRCAADWERREICRLNVLDRFWFEDSRWREKSAYLEFLTDLRGREFAKSSAASTELAS
jgi:hypothetical protein